MAAQDLGDPTTTSRGGRQASPCRTSISSSERNSAPCDEAAHLNAPCAINASPAPPIPSSPVLERWREVASSSSRRWRDAPSSPFDALARHIILLFGAWRWMKEGGRCDVHGFTPLRQPRRDMRGLARAAWRLLDRSSSSLRVGVTFHLPLLKRGGR